MASLKELKIKILKGGKTFEDERGSIINYELTEPINWIGLVSSKAGAVRANHYHPIQEQKVLLVSGCYIGVYRDINNPEVVEHQLIKAGDIEVISPNIAHAMIFLEDSIFINLVRGEREHENFGKHTIPFKVVDSEAAREYLAKYENE